MTIHDAARAALLALAFAPGVVLAGTAAEEPAVGRGGALRLTAEPRRLAVGQAGAVLRIEAPPDVRDLTLSANAGTVERLARSDRGVFTARFVAPPRRLPRVAIVAAIGRTATGALVDGWIAIPIEGTGRARIRASPGAEVALRVGDRTFGPVVADAAGTAEVVVVVPPGVREAHQGFVPIELGVPETSLLHAVADRSTVSAEGGGEVPFRAYVVAPHGAARRGDVPAFAATRGSVSFAEREPGAIEGVWRLPPGPPGEARLTISLPGAAASTASLRVDAVPAEPVLVAALPADGGAAERSGTSLPVSGTSPAVSGTSLAVSGAALAGRGPGGPSAALAVERGLAADPRLVLRLDVRLGWSEGADADHTLGVALAGVAARQPLGHGLQLWTGVGLGVGVARTDAAGSVAARAGPAAGVALGVGAPRRWGTPFVELGALATTDLVPGRGAIGLVTVGAGVRFDLGRRAER